MHKYFFIGGFLALSMFSVGSIASAGNDGVKSELPVVNPVSVAVSREQQKTIRAEKIKAKIKAIKERRLQSRNKVAEPTPLYRKNVQGSAGIKAKIEASKGSGKHGSAKIKSFFHEFFGNPEAAGKVKKLTFKQRLALQKAKDKKKSEERKKAMLARKNKRR